MAGPSASVGSALSPLTIATTGSGSEPRQVLLGAHALEWSAAATHQALGGPGRWVLALPESHIAGRQVVNRAILAAHADVPGALIRTSDDDGDPLTALAAALRRAQSDDAAQVYISLVPTQLYRVLRAAEPLRGELLGLLAQCRAVLVGGAAVPDELKLAAREHGIRLVATYGMTETAGGCLYDGVPLPGVRVRIANPDAAGVGLIEIAGPMLATGYAPLAAPSPFYIEAGERWFRTRDLGYIADREAGRPQGPPLQVSGSGMDSGRPQGSPLRHTDSPPGGATVGPERRRTLVVVGRADRVIISGGVNVHPAPVEAALRGALATAGLKAGAVVVVGVPDPEWGERIVAFIEVPDYPAAPTQTVIAGWTRNPCASALQHQLKLDGLPPAAIPQQIFAMASLPTFPNGKINYASIQELALSCGSLLEPDSCLDAKIAG